MKQLISKGLISLFLISFLIYSCDGPCEDGYKNRKFPESVWTENLNQFIPMSSVRLNNYTQTAGQYCNYVSNPIVCVTTQASNSFCSGQEFQFKNPCDSHIDFIIANKQFDIVVPRVGRDEMIKIYINDVNSSNMSMNSRNQKLNIVIEFESQNTEIVGACHNNFFCFTGTPKFELNNMVLNLGFDLSVVGNSITYSDVEVTMEADFSNSGMCRDHVFAFLCGNQRNVIFQSIVDGMRTQLLNQDNKSLISNSLNLAIRNSTNLMNTEIRIISIDESNNLIVNIPCSS